MYAAAGQPNPPAPTRSTAALFSRSCPGRSERSLASYLQIRIDAAFPTNLRRQNRGLSAAVHISRIHLA